MRRSRSVLLASVLAVVTALGIVGVPAAAGQPLRYVALGDSSASGPLIPNQIDALCARSDHDWPHLLAARLGASLTDVTCAGARTTDLPTRQFPALRADTDFVTLAIGANDIDVGGGLAFCAGSSWSGSTCQQRLSTGGTDRYTARIAALAPTIAAALTEIHRRAPRAAVLVVGYLTYWRPGGCYPSDPMTPADADYMQAVFDRLMTMLAEQAAANNAWYADIRGASVGHGLCEPSARRWVEGVHPTVPAYAYHPNATGMANVSAIIGRALGH